MSMNSIWVTMTLMLVLNSCGSANFNKIFGSKDESLAGLLESAQIAYDKGDYDLAEEYATKAYEKTDNNGEAAILLGNIMMSKAGIDIFQLVAKLSEVSKSASSNTAKTTTAQTCAVSSTDAAGSISRLSCLILNLSEDDVAALGGSVALTSPGLKSLGSYYKPALVDEALRAKVSVLRNADKGIRYLCPFVDKTIVLKDSVDERHALANCGDKSSTQFNGVKVHIAFALLHLVETLVYQKSILVDGAAAGAESAQVGINSISKTANAATYSSAADFVSTMNEVNTVITNLADTTSNNSQLTLALDGLIVVANSFSAAGVPAKVTSAITGGLTKLRETASKLSQAAGNATGNYEAQAFKGQISEKYAKSTATKIDSYCTENASGCAAQKTEICASYSNISQGVDPSKVTTPDLCK